MEVFHILDYRLTTFITLYKILNYTETAKALHITQPAVSQHIKYLEDYYKTKLFTYENKILTPTHEGESLYLYAIAMKTSADKIKESLELKNLEKPSLSFGTTLTIGEYTMRDILKKTLIDFKNLKLSMNVSNTKNLLSQLRDGQIDFAILEGHFDKAQYASFPFKSVDFIGVASPKHDFSNKSITFHDLLEENIILREEGSGTRNIFLQILYEQNFTLDSLHHYIEIGNMSIIKDLVLENFGLSFLYKESVEKELNNGSLKALDIHGFDVQREFNFVYLKGSLHKDEYIQWFNYFIKQSK